MLRGLTAHPGDQAWHMADSPHGDVHAGDADASLDRFLCLVEREAETNDVLANLAPVLERRDLVGLRNHAIHALLTVAALNHRNQQRPNATVSQQIFALALAVLDIYLAKLPPHVELAGPAGIMHLAAATSYAITQKYLDVEALNPFILEAHFLTARRNIEVQEPRLFAKLEYNLDIVTPCRCISALTAALEGNWDRDRIWYRANARCNFMLSVRNLSVVRTAYHYGASVLAGACVCYALSEELHASNSHNASAVRDMCEAFVQRFFPNNEEVMHECFAFVRAVEAANAAPALVLPGQPAPDGRSLVVQGTAASLGPDGAGDAHTGVDPHAARGRPLPDAMDGVSEAGVEDGGGGCGGDAGAALPGAEHAAPSHHADRGLTHHEHQQQDGDGHLGQSRVHAGSGQDGHAAMQTEEDESGHAATAVAQVRGPSPEAHHNQHGNEPYHHHTQADPHHPLQQDIHGSSRQQNGHEPDADSGVHTQTPVSRSRLLEEGVCITRRQQEQQQQQQQQGQEQGRKQHVTELREVVSSDGTLLAEHIEQMTAAMGEGANLPHASGPHERGNESTPRVRARILHAELTDEERRAMRRRPRFTPLLPPEGDGANRADDDADNNGDEDEDDEEFVSSEVEFYTVLNSDDDDGDDSDDPELTYENYDFLTRKRINKSSSGKQKAEEQQAGQEKEDKGDNAHTATAGDATPATALPTRDDAVQGEGMGEAQQVRANQEGSHQGHSNDSGGGRGREGAGAAAIAVEDNVERAVAAKERKGGRQSPKNPSSMDAHGARGPATLAEVAAVASGRAVVEHTGEDTAYDGDAEGDDGCIHRGDGGGAGSGNRRSRRSVSTPTSPARRLRRSPRRRPAARRHVVRSLRPRSSAAESAVHGFSTDAKPSTAGGSSTNTAGSGDGAGGVLKILAPAEAVHGKAEQADGDGALAIEISQCGSAHVRADARCASRASEQSPCSQLQALSQQQHSSSPSPTASPPRVPRVSRERAPLTGRPATRSSRARTTTRSSMRAFLDAAQ